MLDRMFETPKRTILSLSYEAHTTTAATITEEPPHGYIDSVVYLGRDVDTGEGGEVRDRAVGAPGPVG